MKYYLFIFFLLLGCTSGAQEPADGLPSWEEETEDSISAMSFVRIKKPKALLDSIIVQVIRDLQVSGGEKGHRLAPEHLQMRISCQGKHQD